MSICIQHLKTNYDITVSYQAMCFQVFVNCVTTLG